MRRWLVRCPFGMSNNNQRVDVWRWRRVVGHQHIFFAPFIQYYPRIREGISADQFRKSRKDPSHSRSYISTAPFFLGLRVRGGANCFNFCLYTIPGIVFEENHCKAIQYPTEPFLFSEVLLCTVLKASQCGSGAVLVQIDRGAPCSSFCFLRSSNYSIRGMPGIQSLRVVISGDSPALIIHTAILACFLNSLGKTAVFLLS